MAGNSFGQSFRITTAGESHGPANVVIIDGVPPGIPLSVEDLMVDLNRRRPGQSHIVTQRDESDTPEILSGLFEGRTTGTSLAILIRNQDQRSRDYGDIKDLYRPGHADYSFDAKYGFRDYRGGGRSSARETTARVAAGVVAKKIIEAAVKDLARAEGRVAVRFEPLEERLVAPQLLRRAEPRAERVHARGGGPQPGEQARPRRVAQRRLAVRVGERRPARRELVHVRRYHLRVAAERPDPVVQVVDGDEQHVRPLGAASDRREG